MPKVIKGSPGGSPPPSPQSGARPSAPALLGANKGPGPKILEKEVVGAHAEAKKLVADAMQQREEILRRAQAEAQGMMKQAYQRGHEEGLGRFTEQVTRALLEIKKKEARIEGDFVKLVRVCVEKILGQELKTNPEAIVGIVRNALHDARQQREVIVRANPADIEVLRKNQSRLLEMLARATMIEIRGDPAVSPGGCVIVTELGTIDATLERQLQALQAALDEETAEGSPEAGAYNPNEGELDPEDDPGYGGPA